MKHMKEERLDIGRRIYDGEISKYTAAEKCGISVSCARDYMRFYRNINGLPPKDLKGPRAKRIPAQKDPETMEDLESMNMIHPGLCVRGTRLPGSFDPFEMAVRAVLGQQITVKGARTLAARLVETYGRPVQTGIEGLTHAFPSSEDIIALDGPISNHLGPLGIIGARANTILELARALVQGNIEFNFYAQPEIEVQKLMAISGIGPWTAQYIAMRAMGWPDAFLHTDYGVKKALAPRTSKEKADLIRAEAKKNFMVV
jgi:AraC family transcriptional regulator of adaptative response / DNA-3-methyladenine glycosylase II